MSVRTTFLSKFLGLILVVVGLSMLTQGRLMAETAVGIMRDRPLVYVTGIFTLACGVAMVLLHNRWSGGALAVVVTVLGWIMLVKGAVLILMPPEMAINLLGAIRVGEMIYLYAAVDLALGIYLSVAGFGARPEPG
jgi:hypothetical protein